VQQKTEEVASAGTPTTRIFREHPGYRRYIALGLITLVLTVSTADRATLSVAGPSISRDLGIDSIQLGWLFSAFAWTYASGQVPAGWLVDRVGTKWGILGGLFMWSIATVAMAGVGWSPWPVVILGALRLSLGLFEAPVGPAGGRVIVAWFPTSERGLAGSVFNSAQYLALLIFLPLMGWLNYHFSWHSVFAVLGILGLFVTLAWHRFFHDPSHDPSLSKRELTYITSGGALADIDSGDSNNGDTSAKESPLGILDVLKLFKSRMLVGIFLAQYCINAMTWFFVSWFPSYLVNGRGYSILTAGFIAMLPALSGWFGSLSSGLFSDFLLKRTGSLSLARKIPITFGLILSSIIITCNYIQSKWLIVAVMSLALFGKGIASGLVWTVIADTAPRKMIGLAGGVSNSFANFSGVVTPLVIGYILAGTGSFNDVLLYVSLNGLAAVVFYWFIVGPIQRLEIDAEAA
jgi:MFS transporter, ACS family, glucarate transporter